MTEEIISDMYFKKVAERGRDKPLKKNWTYVTHIIFLRACPQWLSNNN